MQETILRQPNKWQQTLALTRSEKEILYWWARGWWKTDAGIYRLTRRIDNPWLRALVLRTTYDDLVDWIDRAMVAYEPFGAKRSWLPVQIVFPSGAIIRTGYLSGQSYDKYKWHEYQKIIIEELTQIPGEDSYEKLLWSLRSTVEGLKPQIFLTTNPDGVGRLRVKRRFVDVAPPWERYTDEYWNTRVFIPAKVQDNMVLLEKDPWYMQTLEGIKDDQLRRAWLEWDWDAFDVKGAIYSSQLQQARKEQRICKLPFDKNLPVYTAWDLWMKDYTAILFFQRKGKEVRVIDSYYNSWEPLEFYAEFIRQRVEKEGYRIELNYLPHDAKAKSRQTGKTDYDILSEMWLRCSVLSRANDLWTEIGIARQMFAHCYFDSVKCQTLVEHLEIYRKEFDENHQIFKDRPFHWPESHFADAFRYMCVAVSPMMQDSIEEETYSLDLDKLYHL